MHASDLFSRLHEAIAARHLPTFHASLKICGISPLIVAECLVLGACATKSLIPYSVDTPPLILVPASQAGVQDKRGRFREIYCSVLQARGPGVPDYRPCEEALTRVGSEAVGTSKPVALGPSKRHLIGAIVPGLVYECIEPWLQAPGTVAKHLQQFGYDFVHIKVAALSSSASNARQIRDTIMAMPAETAQARLVLIGYSKGAPDILEAVVTYPEIRSRVAAVVSASGAIGGSALANDSEQSDAEWMRHFPGAVCPLGDGGAVDSLRTGTRKKWLAQNPLPQELRYYSLVTFPQPNRISSILSRSYDKLAQIDPRNDGQLLFFDQVIPGSTLMGYVNADHWALAVPIARTHTTISSLFVTQNAYPREELTEAILRFVEEESGTP